MLFLKEVEFKLPTHLCVGVRKSGTTWIWKQLENHPDVFVSRKKEIYFFNIFYYKNINWYKSHFKTNKKIVIDNTPDYFYDTCAEKIIKDLPKSKIIVCLRNPIERAYSHWKFGIFMNNCSENFLASWNKNWNQIKYQGLYDKHLTAYLKHFELDKTIIVLFYDNLKNDCAEFLHKIFNYMDIDVVTSASCHEKVIPGSKGFDKFIKDKNLHNFQSKREYLYNLFHKKNIISKNDYNIVKNYYLNSINCIENILKKNLSHWKIDYEEFINEKF